jgi:hypothetical protein
VLVFASGRVRADLRQFCFSSNSQDTSAVRKLDGFRDLFFLIQWFAFFLASALFILVFHLMAPRYTGNAENGSAFLN